MQGSEHTWVRMSFVAGFVNAVLTVHETLKILRSQAGRGQKSQHYIGFNCFIKKIQCGLLNRIIEGFNPNVRNLGSLLIMIGFVVLEEIVLGKKRQFLS